MGPANTLNPTVDWRVVMKDPRFDTLSTERQEAIREMVAKQNPAPTPGAGVRKKQSRRRSKIAKASRKRNRK